MAGHVGNHTATTNSSRLNERIEWEKNFNKEQEAKRIAPIKKLEAELARNAGKIEAENLRFELQQLRYRLTHEPSQDFQAPTYDGRFNSATEVEQAIKSAAASFAAKHPEDVTLVTQFLRQQPVDVLIDASREDVWELALKYIKAKEQEVTSKYTPAPTVAEPEVLTPYQERFAELDRKLEDLKPGTREHNAVTKEKYLWELKQETIGGGDEGFSLCMKEICDDSVTSEYPDGLIIPSDVLIKFRTYLSGESGRRYKAGLARKDSYRSTLRRAWSNFTDTSFWASLEERAEWDRIRRNDSCSADSMKRALGCFDGSQKTPVRAIR